MEMSPFMERLAIRVRFVPRTYFAPLTGAIRGIREGDQLPSVMLVPETVAVPQVTLTLSPSKIGLSEQTGISWRERCLGLLDRHGPAGLAFLESILRAADVRASRLKTNDPALPPEAKQ